MTIEIIHGDCRAALEFMPSLSVNCIVTSPPYFGLRDYGVEGQMGLEPSPDDFVAGMVSLFHEARRVLRDDGTLWLNLGDSYAGSWGAQGRSGQMADRSVVQARSISAHPQKASRTGSIPAGSGLKSKDLIGIPWRVAFALRADGWYLRQDIIWHKPNPMPESVTDRCTKAHEYIFLLTKSPTYYFDAAAIKEPAVGPAGGNTKPNKSFDHDPVKHRTKAGLAASQQRARDAGGFLTRNKRDVWTVTSKPFKDAHFATFPPDLIEPCILAGCPPGGTVLDPFFGAGTTGLVAQKHGRNAIGIELNPEYIEIAKRRLGLTPTFNTGVFA
jgi:DNA modification methylase